MQLARSPRFWVYCLLVMCIPVLIGACGATVPEPPFQGVMVPTRIPTSTPAPIAVADVPINAIFPVAEADTLEFDAPYTGEISDDNYAVLLTFAGQAGQTVDIETDAEEGAVDTFLILRTADGRELARNDDRDADNRSAALFGVELPEKGNYTVVVTRFRQRFGETEGEFTATLSEAAGGNPPTDRTRLIGYDVAQFGTINSTDATEAYTFEGAAGDVITATMTATSGNLDPTLRLTDEAGNEIAINSDINRVSDPNAQIADYTLPYSGYYTLIATRYLAARGSSTGQYDLVVRQTDSTAPEALQAQVSAVLSYYESSTLYEDNLGLMEAEGGFFVGDRLDGDVGEIEVQTVLAFYLPIMPSVDGNVVIAEAALDLRRCVEDGLGFDAVSGFFVYTDAIQRLTSQTSFLPGDEAELLGNPNACVIVDVTEAVQRAYDAQQTLVQFRVVPQASLENEQTDALIFTDPRLTLTLEG